MATDPLVFIAVTSLAVVTIAYFLKSDETKTRSSLSRRSNSLGRLSSSSKKSLGSNSVSSYKTAVSRASSTKKNKQRIISV
jgi:hypothetical protein